MEKIDIYNKIVEALNAKGHKAVVQVVTEPWTNVFIKLEAYPDTHVYIDVSYENAGHWGYRNNKNRKQYITVGDYGNRSVFRQLKTGEFNYDKIADKIATDVALRDSQNTHYTKASERRAQNGVVAEDFKQANNLTYVSDFRVHANDDYESTDELIVTFKISKAMSPTEAQKLLDLLKANGLA